MQQNGVALQAPGGPSGAETRPSHQPAVPPQSEAQPVQQNSFVEETFFLVQQVAMASCPVVRAAVQLPERAGVSADQEGVGQHSQTSEDHAV